ncbi:unnamed protein product [Dovyalis caffra]|uniref:SKP1-like protein n=1 Tax=Dovyalis caffra TaxID=77055 RepID=A0AAV1SR11_9ROSI|nr:unnamed protein product [Dovyalis caffra]
MSSSKKIILKTLDGGTIEILDEIALESKTIKHLMELEDWPDNVIPLPNITGRILAKVIEYCNEHIGDEDEKGIEKLESDGDFVKVDKDTLFEIVLAANYLNDYLNIKGLLVLTCKAVADKIQGMSVGEIRQYLNISFNFSPEEELHIRREEQLAFE